MDYDNFTLHDLEEFDPQLWAYRKRRKAYANRTTMHNDLYQRHFTPSTPPAPTRLDRFSQRIGDLDLSPEHLKVKIKGVLHKLHKVLPKIRVPSRGSKTSELPLPPSKIRAPVAPTTQSDARSRPKNPLRLKHAGFELPPEDTVEPHELPKNAWNIRDLASATSTMKSKHANGNQELVHDDQAELFAFEPRMDPTRATIRVVHDTSDSEVEIVASSSRRTSRSASCDVETADTSLDEYHDHESNVHGSRSSCETFLSDDKAGPTASTGSVSSGQERCSWEPSTPTTTHSTIGADDEESREYKIHAQQLLDEWKASIPVEHPLKSPSKAGSTHVESPAKPLRRRKTIEVFEDANNHDNSPTKTPKSVTSQPRHREPLATATNTPNLHVSKVCDKSGVTKKLRQSPSLTEEEVARIAAAVREQNLKVSRQGKQASSRRCGPSLTDQEITIIAKEAAEYNAKYEARMAASAKQTLRKFKSLTDGDILRMMEEAKLFNAQCEADMDAETIA